VEALGKLKHAHEMWNSNVFLVGKEEHRAPVTELTAGTFHEIRQRLKFIDVEQVQRLYERKLAYRDMENQLGIFA
jgi:hypothetical protein